MRISLTTVAAGLFDARPEATPFTDAIDRFYCWHLHLYTVGRRRVGVLVNDLTGFVVYLDRPTKVKMKRFAQDVRGMIERAWLDWGIAPEWIERYFEAAGEVKFNAKTDRSTLGRLRQFKDVMMWYFQNEDVWPFDPSTFDQSLYGRIAQPYAWGGINSPSELTTNAFVERFGADPAAVFVQAYCRLRIELMGLHKPVMREIAVPAAMSLADLHGLIQVTFGWLDSHLHQYEGHRLNADPAQVRHPLWVSYPKEGIEDWWYPGSVGSVCEDFTRIKDVFAPGVDVWYQYDLGDNWQHKITLLATERRADRRPMLEGYVGVCPPDDAGGPSGFERLLDQLNNPKDPEYAHAVSWTRQMIGHRYSEEELRQKLRTGNWVADYWRRVDRLWYGQEDE